MAGAGGASGQRLIMLAIVALFSLYILFTPTCNNNNNSSNNSNSVGDAPRGSSDLDAQKGGSGGARNAAHVASAVAVDARSSPSVVAPRVLDYASDTFSFKVNTSICRTAERVGNGGDGGWNICTDTFPDKKRPCLIYSYGIRDDFTFDDGMDKRFECTIHGFDPSVPEMAGPYQSGTQRRFFHPEGVGKVGVYPPGTAPFRWPGINFMRESNTKTWTLGSVEGHMKTLGHTHMKIFKIDVEGSEWDTLTGMITSGLLSSGRIEQIVIEIHFDEAFYNTGSPDANTVTISRKFPQPANDPMNYLAIMHTMVESGYILWRWQWNFFSHCCIELSFMHKSAVAAH